MYSWNQLKGFAQNIFKEQKHTHVYEVNETLDVDYEEENKVGFLEINDLLKEEK